jgi:hypothetical protein
MHIPILSERQKRRILPILLRVEELHLAQCKRPDECQMLRRLREDIAELSTMLSQPPAKHCRQPDRSRPSSRRSR